MYARLKNFLSHNSSVSQTIAKNTAWLFMSQFFGRLLRATIVIYAARVLGATSWGAFSYAVGVAAFLTLFADVGINALITKEGARDPELKKRYLATALGIKLVFVAIVTSAAIWVFPYLTSIKEAVALMPLIILVFAFDTLRDLGNALARANEQMEIEASTNIFTNFAIAALGFTALYVKPTSYSLALAYVGGSGLGFILTVALLRTYFTNLRAHFTPHLIGQILKTAWPFGLMGMMGAIMLNTDIVMLGAMRSAAEVGYYSAAQKLILLAYVIPALFSSSAFPALARLSKSAPNEARRILEHALAAVLLISIPLAIISLLLAPQIITLTFGSTYVNAILTFQILVFTFLIVFPSTVLGNALFAYDGQNFFLIYVTLSAIANAVLDYVLIKPWGIEGAAIATVATQLISNTFLYIKVKNLTGFKVWPEIKTILTKLIK